MTPCADAEHSTARYRTNPQLLTRRVVAGSLVCTPAQSAYQDVRVLRLDELATQLVTIARVPCTRDELVAALAPAPHDDVEGLLDGLIASRVLERVAAP